MKKLSILFALASILFVASCAKEVRVDNATKEPVDSIHITIIAAEKPVPITAAGTRTFVDGSAIKWSDSGEKVKVWEVATPSAGDPVTSAGTSAEGVTTNSGAKISFGISMEDKSGGSYDTFDYYAVYPSSAYQTGSVVTNIALNTAAAQTPTATSFDASRDLLIGKKVENGGSQASTLNMQFARMVAIGKMTVKNLGSDEDITKITFSAKVGAEDVILAGRTAFNLETGLPATSYGSNTAEHSIILNYDGQSIKANSAAGMVAYFTCYPFAINSETPGSFKVVVETATKSFTKEVNVSSAKGLAFITGKASTFSVDMDGIVGEAKTVDLRYAYLDYEDYVNAGGTDSYSNLTINKTHGDSWETFVATTNGAIGIGNLSSEKPNPKASYIKLPDFDKDIKRVVVYYQSITEDKNILLETTAAGTNGSIASLTTTGNLVYTFDITSKSVKTAYLRSKGFQSIISKIEVYAGDDNRVALDAPTNVAASLNNDDANVTNSIDVSWDAVAGAGSYEITLMDENTHITTRIAASSPYTVTGLDYEMEYVISVKALPADLYINTESSETDAPSDVTTGSDPSSAHYERVTNLSNVSSGEYIIVNAGYYLPNDAATSAGPIKKAVTIVNNKVQNVTADMTWTFSGSTSAMTIQSTADDDNYLYATNDNNGIRVSTTDSQTWTIDDYSGTSGAFTLKNNTRNRFCATYSPGSDWRSYNTYNAGNYGDGGRVYLYKFVDNRSGAPISWSSNTGTATWSSSGITSSLPSLSNSESLDVSYSSSTESVATINSSGVVTIVGGGSTTISATFTALPASSYKTTTVSYTLTVTDSRSTCATPTFDPAAGAVAANTSVAISCGTVGATIHYTVDGSTPTEGSPIYSSAITIDAAKTIKAIAVKENYKNSEVALAAYTIAGVSKKTYTLTIDASDFNTTSYAANNNEKTSNAVASDSSTYEVKWTSNQVMKSGSNMQWQKSAGYIYNSTNLGTVKSVTVNSSAGSFTTYYGTEENPSSGVSGEGKGFFKTKVGGATGTTSSVVIVFEN